MRLLQPILAGLVSAVVGYASSFTILLTGLQAAGATPRQAASGLLAVCLGIAVATILALAAALAGAVTEPDGREAAVITFVATASGVSLLGVGSAFWGLLAAGLALLLRKPRPVMAERAG